MESEGPQVVISDVRMPEGSGVEFLREIRKLDPRMPYVILVSGFSDITVEEDVDAGAEALFQKPFDRKNMLSCLDELILPLEDRWTQKRGSSRVPTSLSVTISVGSLERDPESEVLNVGKGGFFLALKESFPNIGDRIEFTFNVTEMNTTIQGVGIVRWVRKENAANLPTGCGIQFVELSPHSRRLLIEYLNNLKTYAIIPRS